MKGRGGLGGIERATRSHVVANGGMWHVGYMWWPRRAVGIWWPRGGLAGAGGGEGWPPVQLPNLCTVHSAPLNA